MIYNMYIFDRLGTCVHYAEWNRTNASNLPKEEVTFYSLKFVLSHNKIETTEYSNYPKYSQLKSHLILKSHSYLN